MLFSAAFAVLTLGFLVQRRGGLGASKHPQQDGLPLNELGQETAEDTGRLDNARGFPAWQISDAFTFRRVQPRQALIALIVLRVESLRQVLGNTQCAVLTWEPLIPVLLICWDYFQHKLFDKPSHTSSSRIIDEQKIGSSDFRYAALLGLFSVSALLAMATSRDPPSTFICASTLHNRWYIPLIQRIGTLLDVAIVRFICHQQAFEPNLKGSFRAVDVGSQLVSSGSAIMVGFLLLSSASNT